MSISLVFLLFPSALRHFSIQSLEKNRHPPVSKSFRDRAKDCKARHEPTYHSHSILGNFQTNTLDFGIFSFPVKPWETCHSGHSKIRTPIRDGLEPWGYGKEDVLKDWRSVPAKIPRAMVFLPPRPWMRLVGFPVDIFGCFWLCFLVDLMPYLCGSAVGKTQFDTGPTAFRRRSRLRHGFADVWPDQYRAALSTLHVLSGRHMEPDWFGWCKDEFWCVIAMILHRFLQLCSRERVKSIPMLQGEIDSFHLAGEASRLSCTSGCGAWYCTEAAWQRWYADQMAWL